MMKQADILPRFATHLCLYLLRTWNTATVIWAWWINNNPVLGRRMYYVFQNLGTVQWSNKVGFAKIGFERATTTTPTKLKASLPQFHKQKLSLWVLDACFENVYSPQERHKHSPTYKNHIMFGSHRLYNGCTHFHMQIRCKKHPRCISTCPRPM